MTRSETKVGVRALINRAIPLENRDEQQIQECVKEFREIYRKNFNVVTKPYTGIPEMLDRLMERRVRMAILSNKPDDFTKKCVKEFLSKWNFEIALGHSDSIPLKPDPAGAIYIAQKMEVDPDSFLYLGDTDIDMKTAVRANMFPVGALWGFRLKNELIENGAKAVIETPKDIFRMLD